MLCRLWFTPFWVVLFTAVVADAHEWPDFQELVAAASPAVVRIDVYPEELKNQPKLGEEKSLPDTYYDFFEHSPGDILEGHATGSGFIISSDGYVLTNHHVVAGARRVDVKLIDRRTFEAEVVGADRRSDLALLKIPADQLPTLDFADSGTVGVGQWVIAIGAPFGLDYSASAGIISAKGRSIPSENGDSYVPFLQSDVATNPGNSGGPLLNLEGEVVGINTQIFSRPGGGYIGLSFAVPVDVARLVVEQLRAKGHVSRGWLGVYVQEVDANLAKAAGLKLSTGGFVAQVQSDSPADRAGVLAGDIIISLDGHNITEPAVLPRIAGSLLPGSQVDLGLLRGKELHHLTVTIGELTDNDN